MKGAFETTASTHLEPLRVPRLQVWQRPLQAVVIGFILLLLGVAVGALLRFDQVPPNELMRFTVTVPAEEQLTVADNVDVAVSPNGRLIAYISGLRADILGPKKLLLQSLDDVTPTTLASDSSLYAPFFSPDSEWVGVYDLGERALRRVSVQGGSAVKISDVPGIIRGASWGIDDTIIFATADGGLWRVAASGGVPEQLTTPDTTQGERGHFWPAFLPGGQEVLFTVIANSMEESLIAVLSLDSLEQKVLVRGGSYPRFSPTGHLLYGMQGNMWAIGFDRDRLETIGDPVLVQEGVTTKPLGAADFAISDNGRLVYVPGGGEGAEGTLVLVDRQGEVNNLPLALDNYLYPRFSPDGTRVAVQINGATGDSNIFIYELAGNRLRQLTFDGGTVPLWTPDGTQVTFLTNDELWNVASDFSEEPKLLSVASEEFGMGGPYSWSPDGKVLFWSAAGDLNQLALLEDGGVEHSPLLREPYGEVNPRFSANGNWFVYESNETGSEVYVQPYPPGSGVKRRITQSGGLNPVWAGSGRELFYENDGQLWVVRISTEPVLEWQDPVALFENRWRLDFGDFNNYDVSPDGQQFVFVQLVTDSGELNRINVVLNWFEELKERVPVP